MGDDLKQKLSEEDIKLRYITPALDNSGWKREHIRMEYAFTDGTILLNGKKPTRKAQKRADYLLYYKTLSTNQPIAIVEAKDNNHGVSDGLQQAIAYAKILDIPFAYSSNGDAFVEYDMTTGIESIISLNDFPSPETLWRRFTHAKQITPEVERIISTPYAFKQGDFTPRYYQSIAINRTLEAIAKGQNRLLLVMATGTGKTYTAFQIIHRLKSSGLKKKVLFLADRNILLDQTMIQDFKPFERIMTKVKTRI
ncbi:DEAD/DEAH box helicase family protein [Spirabiliibacterium mucosae]|uniref:DEAD/DEAH box helicase family protein n=1 Tax=Spirabiliibacterium mucosae TaxID=28156 RepID=UPI00249F342E|nr:DEAD/DEAH box helicase family protein [Spirabiliibacterium mucosae]